MAATATTLGMVIAAYLYWTGALFMLVLICAGEISAGNCGCQGTQYYGGITKANSNEAFADSGGTPYNTPNSRILQFYPNYLDFREQYVGMPHAESVMLFNPSSEYSIVLNPRKPSSSFFYVSSYDVEEVPPLGNTSVKIVFVAYIPGSIESTVAFATSRGTFNYQVFATGLPNPYRLRSFVGAKIPFNGTFSPYINMFNPYDEPLQIIEMYSSGGDLHLDPPHGSTNNVTKDLWRIPPYETKAIMKVSYHGSKNVFYRGFVRVKCAAPAASEEVVVLPIEVSVTDEPIVFTNIDAFDFGMLRTMDEAKSLSLNLFNNGNSSVTISSITAVPRNKAVSIQHSSVILKPCKKYTRAATITFSAYHVTHKKQSSGMIVITFGNKGHQVLEIPYQATVLKGTMAYSVSRTTFFALDAISKPVTQALTITNTFNFPLLIYNATLPATVNGTFAIMNFTKNLIVQPGKLVSPLSIQHKAKSSDVMATATLRLYTNASIFTIPIHSYSGQVKYSVEGVEQNILEYGTVGTMENRSVTFKIINDNPVEVSIKEFNSNVEFVRLRLLHIQPFKKAKHPKKSNISLEQNNSTRVVIAADEKIVLQPKEVAVFSADMAAPTEEGLHTGEVKILTSYEEIRVPVYVKTVHGSLLAKPRRISFQKMFPGKTERYAVSFTSSFSHPLTIKRIELVPHDPRFVLSWTSSDFPILAPHQRHEVGKVLFNSLLGPTDTCYVCLCNPDPVCLQWLESLSLPIQTWEIDLDLLEKSKRIWDGLVSNGETSLNASLVVDTEIIRGYSIPLHASLSWPSIVEQSVHFPPTHVNNVSVEHMTLTNPADVPVVVQVMSLHSYPHSQGSLDFLADRFEIDSFTFEPNSNEVFYLHDIEDIVPRQRKLMHSKVGVVPALGSYTTILKPRSSTKVMIGFKPLEERTETSVLVVRNNLTVIDLVVVQGQGAKSEFTINERKPGTNSVLLFELKTSHLADCSKDTAKARTFPSFTVKRTFTAANTGRLPIHVTSLNINEYECEGYGFRVLDCSPFILMPNTSRRIDISFAPDFTTSRVVRSLRVITAMEPLLEFTLLATLPRQLLSLCASALPRPFWEPYLHVIVALVMSSAFVVVIFLAYFDAQKYVLQCTFTFSRNKSGNDLYPMGTVFDLNAVVGANTRFDDRRSGKCFNPSDHQSSFTLKNKLIDNSNAHHVSRSRSSSSSSDGSHKSSTTSSQNGIAGVENALSRDRLQDADGGSAKKKRGGSSRHDTVAGSRQDGKQQRRKSQQQDFDAVSPFPLGKPRIVYEDTLDAVQQDDEKRSKVKKRPKISNIKKEINKQSTSPSTAKEHTKEQMETVANGFHPRTSARRPPLQMTSFYKSSYDKLDDISITGPKPDLTQFTNAIREQNRAKHVHASSHTDTKRKLHTCGLQQQHSELTRALVDPPSRPPAASLYAVVQKSLSHKQQRKTCDQGKRKGEPTALLEGGLSCPSSPSSSTGSLGNGRASSDSSVKLESHRTGHRSSPRREDSSSSARSPPGNEAWPFVKGHVAVPSDSAATSPARSSTKDATSRPNDVFVWPNSSGGGSGSGGKKQANMSAASNSDSMFFYDNLSSLRATKEFGVLDRAPGSKKTFSSMSDERPVIKSKLSADSAEFVPSTVRLAPIGSRQRVLDTTAMPSPSRGPVAVSSLWGEPSVSNEQHRGSPGLTMDSSSWSSAFTGFMGNGGKRESGSHLLPSFGQDNSNFSNLLPANISDDDNDESFGQSSFRCDGPMAGDDSDVWCRDTDDTTDNSSDFGWTTRNSGLQRSIWSADAATTNSQNVPRSLIGLDLSLPLRPSPSPVEQSSVDHSPLDPFGSIWSSPRDSLDVPYDGWMNDITKTTSS